MSSKNVRYNKIFCGNLKESTPKTLRQQIASKQLLNKSSVTKNENNKSQNNGSILNIGFSQPVCNNKTPVSAKNNQFKGSSTTLNACYTPSSLYNNSTGSTPTSLRGKYTTPKNVLAKLSSGSDPKTPDCFSKVSIETPRRSAKSHNEEGTTSGADCEISNLSVAVRVRPMNAKECLKASAVNIVQVNENEVTVLVGTSADSSAGVSHSFQYDHAFWSCNSEDLHFADQDKVFKSTALHLIDKGFEGYNACLFAYGQTGSGKSYSMMGVEAGDNEEIGSNSEAGIIPRFCKEIFRRVELLKDQVQTEIEVSYFEIYNEKIHDLLCVSQAMNNACDVNKRNALRVREHPVWGPYVVDLSTHPVDSYSSLRNWLTVGNSQRATAATGMNDKSSRSHSIFNIVLNLSEKHDSSSTRNIKHTKRSKISLVDLAGSERISHTCTSGERLREGVSINKSLLTLGKVIAALADTKKISFVPYRESVLTWLLRNCCHSFSKQNNNKVQLSDIPLSYVVDLSTHPVESYSSLRNWLTVGNSQRATAATGMNDKSSRLHSIFNIVLNLSEKHDSSNTRNIKHTKRSKISLVDLAGSERISHTCTSGERLREGVSINKSLLTLGKVIAALADTKKISFVPYRESVLTWLLRESLGGNSKTVMLATISPASIHMDETLATLRYACQARTIVNRVKVNEDKHDRIIRELRAEVERLQALRQDYERQKRHSASAPPRKIIIETSVDESEIETLRLQLAETEKELVKAQTSWMERLNVAEDLRKSEMRMLKRKGLAMELSVEQKQACLVNLAADPILSNTLFYILPPGVVRIGRSRPPAFVQPDIVLEGPLVAFHHCSIENVKGKLFVIPESTEFETFLNGELLQNKQQIYHGDRLVIGGSHYFRISNPTCSKRHKQIIVDFQLAHQEILQKQEKQLRKELEDEKHAALAQIEEERAANERNYKEQIEFLELEKFKYKCSKELLETEKQIIDQKGQEEAFEYTPFKSTLLDNIEKIMQHPSEASLHKTQLMVKEATQRCRDVGINLEFKQAQVLDKFGIFRAVVEILDKDNLRKADWPTARLDVWLDIVRENNIIVNDPFQSVDIEWKPVGDCSDTLSDSLNSSRISLNLSTVKEAVLKKPPNCALEKIENVYNSPQSGMKQPTRNTVLLNSSSNKKIQTTKKMLTYDDDLTPRESLSPNINSSDFSSAACVYLKEIQRSTLKLKKFCDKYIPDENSNQRQPLVDYVSKSIGELEGIVQDVRNKLMESNLSGTSPRTAKSVRFILD